MRFSKDEKQIFKLKEYNRIIEERIKQKELDFSFNKDLLDYFKIQDSPKAQTLFDKLVAKHGIENKKDIFVAFEESLWLLE